MKLYNRNFGVGERIEYMGWVNEAVSNSNQPWQSYRPRFLALKGPDLLLFETPPVRVAYFELFPKLSSASFTREFFSHIKNFIEKYALHSNECNFVFQVFHKFTYIFLYFHSAI